MMGFRASWDRRARHLIAAGIVAVCLAVLVLSPACGTLSSTNLTAAETADDYYDEIRSLEKRGFVLAPGAEWPDPWYTETDEDGVGIAYGKGIGTQDADWRWFDSWASYAVSTSQDATRDNAIQQLMRLRETFLYEGMIPETRAGFDQILDGAAEGNLTRLREYVVANLAEVGIGDKR